VKPFRFGVNVTRPESRAERADKARKIEDLGCSTPNVSDHLAEGLLPAND